MNDIRQYLHVLGENQTLQIDFAGAEQTEKEIEPAQLKEDVTKISVSVCTSYWLWYG